jgi:hypothetical protein
MFSRSEGQRTELMLMLHIYRSEVLSKLFFVRESDTSTGCRREQQAKSFESEANAEAGSSFFYVPGAHEWELLLDLKRGAGYYTKTAPGKRRQAIGSIRKKPFLTQPNQLAATLTNCS